MAAYAQYVCTSRISTNIYVMDNDISAEFTAALTKNNTSYQLVTPHTHRRNLAERAIQTYKNHLKAGLSWCWCPWTVVTGVGRCFDIISAVKPGHELKWEFCIAYINVDLTGEIQDGWRYCVNSMCVLFLWIITASEGLFCVNFTGEYVFASIFCCC